MSGPRNSSRSQSRAPGVGLLAASEGAALIALNLVATPLVARRRRRWGTEGTEDTDPLPGDELVPNPKWSYTLAVDVAAPPEAVWPWVAQIGQGRGGFYTYQGLENLVGCEITNATRVLAEFQDPAVGDEVRLHPATPPLRIQIVERPHAFVLFGSPAEIGGGETWGASTWQFAVLPRGDGESRFLTRGRYDHGPDWKSRLAFGPFPIEPISFVMSRRMMREIKRLAELSVDS